jgi:integrase
LPTSEVLEAKWDEVDFERAIWTIPTSRMKARREHRVPLVPRSVEILVRAKMLAAGSDYLFPGRSIEKPMSNMVFLMALRRMELEVTAHGFRSAFRDWAAERTHFPREVCEWLSRTPSKTRPRQPIGAVICLIAVVT